MDYNARYYSQALGRFISPDTIVPGAENPQAFNRYAYTLNNPLKFTDSTGHCIDQLGISPRVCAIIIGIVVATGILVEADHQGLIRGEARMRPSITPEGCTDTLAECYKANSTKEFKENEQISTDEFNGLLEAIYEDLQDKWTPPIKNPEVWDRGYFAGFYAGRQALDTPFYDNNKEGATVCIGGHECYDQSEVNYVAQGMWGAKSGETLGQTLGVTEAWNSWTHEHPATEGEKYWTKFAYEWYKQRELEEEPGTTP